MHDSLILNKIFNQTSYNHFFELETAEALQNGIARPPIYLSVGTEHIPPCIFQAFNSAGLGLKDYYVFPQHRCHSYYLTFGGVPYRLALELCGSVRGCNKGMGGSASVSNTDTANLIGHSGLLGDQIPIAVGCAHASNKPTVVVLGDAAAEEDYALGSLGFAATKKAPILFICEDNDLSILTKKEIRRSWDIVDVAKGFGIEAVSFRDNPLDIYNKVLDFAANPRPILYNIHCQRHRWHAGAGIDNEPEWNTFEDLVNRVEKTSSPEYVKATMMYDQNRTRSLWRKVSDECSRNN